MRRLNGTSRRRKFFEISKTRVECTENEEEFVAQTVDARVSTVSEIVEDDSRKNELSCIYCDKQFHSKKDVKSHMRVHTEKRPYSCHNAACKKRFKTSSNLRRHEKICKRVTDTIDEITIAEKPSKNIINDDGDNDLFDRILAEEAECPANNQTRLPEIGDYNDMLENLISSSSPDELILKTSISNEIPEVMDELNIPNSKRKPSNIDENLKKRRKTLDYQSDEKKKTIHADSRKLQFENLANEKIFKVLNGSTENFKTYDYKSNDLSYTITLPDFQFTENRNKKKEEISKHKITYENHKCIQKTRNKKSKRGSLGWQLNHQLEDLDDAKDIVDNSDKPKETITHNCIQDDNTTKRDAAYNKSLLENLYSIASNPKIHLKLSENDTREKESERINPDVEADEKILTENTRPESSPSDCVYDMPVLDFL